MGDNPTPSKPKSVWSSFVESLKVGKSKERVIKVFLPTEEFGGDIESCDFKYNSESKSADGVTPTTVHLFLESVIATMNSQLQLGLSLDDWGLAHFTVELSDQLEAEYEALRSPRDTDLDDDELEEKLRKREKRFCKGHAESCIALDDVLGTLFSDKQSVLPLQLLRVRPSRKKKTKRQAPSFEGMSEDAIASLSSSAARSRYSSAAVDESGVKPRGRSRSLIIDESAVASGNRQQLRRRQNSFDGDDDDHKSSSASSNRPRTKSSSVTNFSSLNAEQRRLVYHRAMILDRLRHLQHTQPPLPPSTVVSLAPPPPLPSLAPLSMSLSSASADPVLWPNSISDAASKSSSLLPGTLSLTNSTLPGLHRFIRHLSVVSSVDPQQFRSEANEQRFSAFLKDLPSNLQKKYRELWKRYIDLLDERERSEQYRLDILEKLQAFSIGAPLEAPSSSTSTTLSSSSSASSDSPPPSPQSPISLSSNPPPASDELPLYFAPFVPSATTLKERGGKYDPTHGL